jgi:hypothetical protein
MRRRRTKAAALLLGTLLLWLLALTTRRLAVEPQPPTETAPPPALVPPRTAPVTATAPPAPSSDLPIIDAVVVEKEQVCEGEENLVTVRAHMPREGDEGHLRVMIGSTMGQQVPLRSYLPAPGISEPPRYVLVHGKNGQTARVEVPAFKVKPCREARALFIEAGLLPNTIDEYQLWVTIKDVEAKSPFLPKRYEWTFSDGSTETTELPRTTHRFRQEDRLYSSHLVKCTAVSRDGERVMGRAALELANAEYQAVAFKRVVLLSIAGTPRYPEMDSSGSVTSVIRVWHHREKPVQLEKVSLTYVREDGSQHVESEQDASSVLGTSEVAREGVEAELRFDTRTHPDVKMVNYRFTGTSSDGLPVTGHFSLMKPAPQPTPESEPVTNPVLLARILRAREYLKKDTVSDDDLWQLERDGVFADLKVDNAIGDLPHESPGPRRVRSGSLQTVQ